MPANKISTHRPFFRVWYGLTKMFIIPLLRAMKAHARDLRTLAARQRRRDLENDSPWDWDWSDGIGSDPSAQSIDDDGLYDPGLMPAQASNADNDSVPELMDYVTSYITVEDGGISFVLPFLVPVTPTPTIAPTSTIAPIITSSSAASMVSVTSVYIPASSDLSSSPFSSAQQTSSVPAVTSSTSLTPASVSASSSSSSYFSASSTASAFHSTSITTTTTFTASSSASVSPAAFSTTATPTPHYNAVSKAEGERGIIVIIVGVVLLVLALTGLFLYLFRKRLCGSSRSSRSARSKGKERDTGSIEAAETAAHGWASDDTLALPSGHHDTRPSQYTMQNHQRRHSLFSKNTYPKASTSKNPQPDNREDHLMASIQKNHDEWRESMRRQMEAIAPVITHGFDEDLRPSFRIR